MEEFECKVTDILHFQPIVRGLISIGIIEVEGDNRYDDVVPTTVPQQNNEAAMVSQQNL